jgi:phenylacetate-CoA ligase
MTMHPLVPEEVETLGLRGLETLRQSQWTRQREILANSPFYRRVWSGKPPPEHWQDVCQFPLIDKAALRDSQEQHPPFGDYLSTSLERVRRVHRTSGTTGRPMNTALSERDCAMYARVGGRAVRGVGLGPGHIIMHCLNYCLWMGGYTDHATLEAAGATVVPFGVGASEHLIRTMQEIGANAIYCTPSYPTVLERVMAEKFPDIKPRDLNLRIGILTGEPGLENSTFRERVETVWGFRARNLYGISDIVTTFAGECDQGHDLHFAAVDALLPELIDPETGASLAWQEGTTGELVLSHLERECQPLVRFRTGDIVALITTEACPCGRATPRLQIKGRADDMVNVRGVNVFPGAVAAVLNRFAALSGEFRIHLKTPPPFDRLPVEAELALGHPADPELAQEIAETLRTAIRASAEINLLDHGTLPLSEGKSRRVVRSYRQ